MHYAFAAKVGAIGAAIAASAGYIDELPVATLVLMGSIGFLMTGIGTLWMSVDYYGAKQPEQQQSEKESEE